MTLRTSITTAVSSIIFGATMLHAQHPSNPTLNEILERLQTNLDHYDQRVPSFFCDEHILSGIESDAGKHQTITDSIFRLKRVPTSSDVTMLEESRDIKTVDNKPATSQGQELDVPSMPQGVFEGGLAIVSANQTRCMKYSLQRPNKQQPTDTYIIRFSTALTPQNENACLLQEASKGSATLDTSTMQMKHLEITTPHHTIIPGDAYTRPVIGKRTLTIEYSPVLLDSETLWMPSAITMTSISGSDTFHPTFWTFRATYRNCHKLQVTSHIHSGGAPLKP